MKYYLYLSIFLVTSIRFVTNGEPQKLNRDKRQFYPEYIVNNSFLTKQEVLPESATYQQPVQYLPQVIYDPIRYQPAPQPNIPQSQYLPANKQSLQSPFAPQFTNNPQQPAFSHQQPLTYSTPNYLVPQTYQNPYYKIQPVILVQPEFMPKFNNGPMYMQKHMLQDICRNYIPEEQTAIYVLTQKPNFEPEVVEPLPTGNQNKPEVFFVNYKTPEEADLVQRKIQEQYDSLGGTSEVTQEKSTSVKSTEFLEEDPQSKSHILKR